MKTISQRELRNDSGEIMRGLERGESYRVTRRGVPVGMLTPAGHDVLDELTVHPAMGPRVFPAGVSRAERTDDVLSALRGER